MRGVPMAGGAIVCVRRVTAAVSAGQGIVGVAAAGFRRPCRCLSLSVFHTFSPILPMLVAVGQGNYLVDGSCPIGTKIGTKIFFVKTLRRGLLSPSSADSLSLAVCCRLV